MKQLPFVLLLLMLFAYPARTIAQAPVRYALIVGNNHGQAPRGVVLPDLLHAETEAYKVKKKLVSVGNFSKDQVVVITGQGRNNILQTARNLSRRHERDQKNIGSVPTLFFFYFTGHGLDGKLLTADEPLTGEDLGMIFEEFGATITVGIFDACFSGSLDLKRLSGKGLKVFHGFNAFEQMPREVLNSEGTMWFTSSRPDQISYEDEALGGVFTHYFLEGMEKGEKVGYGVTLENVWEYARSETQRHTRVTGRPQTPQMMIRNLTSTGPLYFSFPSKRSAALVFDAQVSGRFLLQYESGQLTEIIDKKAGQAMQVPVFPTDLILERLDAKGSERQRFQVKTGGVVRVRNEGDWRPSSGLGHSDEVLRAKGTKLRGLVLTEKVYALSGLVELGYNAGFGPELSAAPTHAGVLGFRLCYALFTARLAVSWGRAKEQFDAWGYTLNRVKLDLDTGVLFKIGKRFGVSPFARFRWSWQALKYTDDRKRKDAGLGLGGGLNLFVRLVDRPIGVLAYFDASIGGERGAPVAPMDADKEWYLIPWVGVGLSLELL